MSDAVISPGECHHLRGSFRTPEDYRDHLPCDLLADEQTKRPSSARGPEGGKKNDAGKLRYSLLPTGVVEQVVRVLEFGAQKYSVENWRKVLDARTRYYDALMRHVAAWWAGEEDDAESGLPHLAHAICCASFLLASDFTKRAASTLGMSEVMK